MGVQGSAAAASPTGLDQAGGRVDRGEPGRLCATEQGLVGRRRALPGGTCRCVGAPLAGPGHGVGDHALQVSKADIDDGGVTVASEGSRQWGA